MSTAVTSSLNTWRPISQVDRVRMYERGRSCAHPDCDTILSVYNPSTYCNAHAAISARIQRRGLGNAVRDVACEHCGDVFTTRNRARRFCSDRCRMAAFARRKRAAARAKAHRREREALTETAAAEQRVGSAA